MVDLGSNPDWPGSLTLPAILAPRGRRDQEGKALRVSADLNPGHIKKKKNQTSEINFNYIFYLTQCFQHTISIWGRYKSYQKDILHLFFILFNTDDTQHNGLVTFGRPFVTSLFLVPTLQSQNIEAISLEITELATVNSENLMWTIYKFIFTLLCYVLYS